MNTFINVYIRASKLIFGPPEVSRVIIGDQMIEYSEAQLRFRKDNPSELVLIIPMDKVNIFFQSGNEET